MTQGPVVQIENLTIRFGRTEAVSGATLAFAAGASGLLGCNGAGKTTILRALLGLVRPAGGRMEVLGRSPAVDPLFVRSRVGYMPEGHTVFPGLTGFEAVFYAGKLAGLERRVAKRRAHELLHFAGLGEARYRPMEGFSTGMAQRVKLAMAMVGDPDLIFLDEPTNGLDPAGRKEMLACVHTLATRRGKAVILSSHILTDVEEVCREAVLLDRGRVRAQGPIRELTATAERLREVVVAGESTALTAALEAAGLPLYASKPEGDRHRLRVGLPPERSERDIFRALAGAGASVHSLLEVRRPLEEVFNELVGGQA